MIYAGCPAFFGLGLEDGHVPTFWLQLYINQPFKGIFLKGARYFTRVPLASTSLGFHLARADAPVPVPNAAGAMGLGDDSATLDQLDRKP